MFPGVLLYGLGRVFRAALKWWLVAVLKLLLLLEFLCLLSRWGQAVLQHILALAHDLLVSSMMRLTSVFWNQKHHSCTSLWLFSKPCLDSDGANPFLRLASVHHAERDILVKFQHSLWQWHFPHYMADSKLHWDVGDQAEGTAKPEEKAGRYNPLVVFDTAGSSWPEVALSEAGAASCCGSTRASVSLAGRLLVRKKPLLQSDYTWCGFVSLYIGIRLEMFRQCLRQPLIQGLSPTPAHLHQRCGISQGTRKPLCWPPASLLTTNGSSGGSKWHQSLRQSSEDCTFRSLMLVPLAQHSKYYNNQSRCHRLTKTLRCYWLGRTQATCGHEYWLNFWWGFVGWVFAVCCKIGMIKLFESLHPRATRAVGSV